MSQERPVLFGPDGVPANVPPEALEEVTLPKIKLDQMVQNTRQLIGQVQFMNQQLQSAGAELQHWRTLDSWRGYCIGILSGRGHQIINMNANDRKKALDAVSAMAEAMVVLEHERRPKQGQYDNFGKEAAEPPPGGKVVPLEDRTEESVNESLTPVEAGELVEAGA